VLGVPLWASQSPRVHRQNRELTDRDHFVFMGRPVAFEFVAIFEVDDDNKISAWREYFDTASVAKAMGIEQNQINA
jgi:limonene-1,2-epoxide hydrolase